MKIQYRQVKDDTVQITTTDERWYRKELEDGTFVYVPSVTWICGFYPKGIAFYKWLANKGWDESQAIKQAAGDKGSKVHAAITDLLCGNEVKIDDKYINNSTGLEEELTVEEYDCLMSFVAWYNVVKPVTLAKDVVVFNDKLGYAGTLDWIGIINRVEKIDKKTSRMVPELWLLDFKTSGSIWPEYELQVSAYKHSDMAWLELIVADYLQKKHAQETGKSDKDEDFVPDAVDMIKKMKLGILQVGYGHNQKGFKFTDIEDKFELFLSARAIWAEQTAGQAPLQKDYPVKLSLK